MPNELNSIKDKVMSEIREERVKMKPRIYFVVGSILTSIGLMFSVVTSVLFLAITRSAFRGRGFIGRKRLDLWLDNFPWWAPVIGVLGLILGIYMLKRYDFSYKKNFWLLVLVFILSVFAAGWIVEVTGFSDILLHARPMRDVMKW